MRRRWVGVVLLVVGGAALVWILLNPVALHPMKALSLLFQPGRDIEVFSGHTIRIGTREGDTFTDIRVRQNVSAGKGSRSLAAAHGQLVYSEKKDVLTLTLDDVQMDMGIEGVGPASIGRVTLTLSNALGRVLAELD